MTRKPARAARPTATTRRTNLMMMSPFQSAASLRVCPSPPGSLRTAFSRSQPVWAEGRAAARARGHSFWDEQRGRCRTPTETGISPRHDSVEVATGRAANRPGSCVGQSRCCRARGGRSRPTAAAGVGIRRPAAELETASRDRTNAGDLAVPDVHSPAPGAAFQECSAVARSGAMRGLGAALLLWGVISPQSLLRREQPYGYASLGRPTRVKRS
jgi:hypothetical protein